METTGAADGNLADALRQYAAAAFSGVVRVDGQPGGTIYLSGGRISACETSGAPSLEVILLRSRTISESDWDAAFTAAAVGKRPLTAELIERGLIGAGALEAMLRIALADAVFAVVSGRVDGWAEAPAADCLLPLTPAARSGWLLAEATRRGQALAAFPPPALSAQDRVTAAPGARPGRGQDTLLALADGRRTPRDLAFALGRGLYETMLELGRMRAEHLVVTSPSGKDPSPPGDPGDALPDGEDDDRTVTGLPRRRKDRPASPRGTEASRRNLTSIRMLRLRSEGNSA